MLGYVHDRQPDHDLVDAIPDEKREVKHERERKSVIFVILCGPIVFELIIPVTLFL